MTINELCMNSDATQQLDEHDWVPTLEEFSELWTPAELDYLLGAISQKVDWKEEGF